MEKIALLRSNPKDATVGKIVGVLAKKYKVECFVWDRQRDYQPPLVHENVHYTKCTIRAGFYDVRTLLKLLVFELWLLSKLLFARTDCIEAIDLDTGLVGLCAARLRGKAFVYFCADPYYAMLPGSWPAVLGRLAKRLENFVITHADVFIITDLLRMPQHEGARPKKVVEMANIPYMDLSDARPAEADAFVLGYIGSLADGRNLPTIVEAAGELAGEGVRLIIGGFGPLAETIENSARRFGNITYVPWVPYTKLLEMEGGFDLFLYVTDKDSETYRWVSPNKLFESMALGKPIIVGEGTLAATRVAAIGNGVAVPYGSRQELKKAILMFKENSGLALEMGARGRSEFQLNWRPEVMEHRLLKAYAELEEDFERRGRVATDTAGEGYTRRLVDLESGWKRFFDVQRPYRRHLQSLKLGFVLDIGCGLGRNLINLGGRTEGVGVDHNPRSVAVARSRGLVAYSPEEFQSSEYAQKARFDAILLSHVAEHMKRADVVKLVRAYLAYLRPGGRVVFITPQERGFRSDPTHVMFMDFTALASIAEEVGLTVEKQYSFPFPRLIGRIFKYNEFVILCRKP